MSQADAIEQRLRERLGERGYQQLVRGFKMALKVVEQVRETGAVDNMPLAINLPRDAQVTAEMFESLERLVTTFATADPARDDAASDSVAAAISQLRIVARNEHVERSSEDESPQVPRGFASRAHPKAAATVARRVSRVQSADAAHARRSSADGAARKRATHRRAK
jgi:hypothetical protein